jgi:hypothetical protein
MDGAVCRISEEDSEEIFGNEGVDDVLLWRVIPYHAVVPDAVFAGRHLDMNAFFRAIADIDVIISRYLVDRKMAVLAS